MYKSFYSLSRAKCDECSQIILSVKPEVLCASCKNKKNLIRVLGWTAVGGISLSIPPLGGLAVGLMTVIETSILGNPIQNKIHDLSMQLEIANGKIRSREFESLNLQEKVKRLENSNLQLQRSIRQDKLMSDLHTISTIPWLTMANNPSHFGIIRLERVSISTSFEYLDYPLFMDIFIPDTEGKGLLHGGIPIDVINPMVNKSKARKPMLYSYKKNEISYSIDRIH